ncbi:MAG: hypothetical protein WCL19_08815 [Verrucomicrobiota bacterium]
MRFLPGIELTPVCRPWQPANLAPSYRPTRATSGGTRPGKAEKFRKALVELDALISPVQSLAVREEGGKILLENAINRDSVSTDERNMASIPVHPGGTEADSVPDPKRTAEAIGTASRHVYPEWTIATSVGDPGSAADRAIEAQVTAAAEGRKPLYYEPWGSPEVARQFADAYREVLPLIVEVQVKDGNLYVYRAEAIQVIIDSNPVFYNRPGESILDSIHRVSLSHDNGELLGYGAKSLMTRPANEVRIYKGEDLLLYFFVSTPDTNLANQIANERTADFFRAFGWEDLRFEMQKMK